MNGSTIHEGRQPSSPVTTGSAASDVSAQEVPSASRASRQPEHPTPSLLDRAMPEIRSVCVWVAFSSLLRMLAHGL
eukprot:CAMPEP_0194052530 /NCGR_PEP_ID=MMETSP0009_2-20130614/45836_1 /TAXON_ID=210454 /ORGANISM="Grammatophora oceanica, Strain CCMP 410" /LENGTH=75 /DNA_ID=CAMNT_0038700149 /DNA_START=18 /DNA_END=242 /DNA_ORIENTATION=+